MGVHVRSEGVRHAPVKRAMVAEAAERMLSALGREGSELSVLLCNDTLIAELNETYRDKKGPTDVLAFAMSEGEFGQLHAELLGDVVISLDTARRQADARGHAIAAEVRLLLGHGLLHLLGYDHQTPAEYRRMMALQHVLVSAAGPVVPMGQVP